jgi:hypothetical protein
MDRLQIVSIRQFRSSLIEDIEKCTELKKVYYNDESSFGKLMIVTVKLKIIYDFLDIFNTLIRSKGRINDLERNKCLTLMKRITKRIKIHVAQLKKINTYDNEEYYKKILTAVYHCILIKRI